MRRIKVTRSFIIFWILVLFVDTEGVSLVFLIAAAFHEFGHLMAIYLCGGKVMQIRLNATGGEIRYYLPRKTKIRESCIALSGCTFGFILSVTAFLSGMVMLCGASTILTCFNLLPISFLDGGRALGIIWEDCAVLLWIECFTIGLLFLCGIMFVYMWNAYGVLLAAVLLVFLQQSLLRRRKNKGMI